MDVRTEKHIVHKKEHRGSEDQCLGRQFYTVRFATGLVYVKHDIHHETVLRELGFKSY